MKQKYNKDYLNKLIKKAKPWIKKINVQEWLDEIKGRDEKW
jgi:hypothetical protein